MPAVMKVLTPTQRKLVAFAEKVLGFGLRRIVYWPKVATPIPEAELEARTARYNEASEKYFADYPNAEFLLKKPFADPLHYPQYLFSLGVLFHGLKVSPGDVVIEMGAGSCWVSHFLNLYGCRTISIDISPTALDLGRQLFKRSNQTRWELEPKFLPYDGHRIPLPDASVDRIVWNDAFHHIPNQREILREMARVLRDGGVVAMCEPGRIHSVTPDSQKEMDETGVLENDIVVEELEARALQSGFAACTVLPISLPGTPEIPASGLHGFLTGKGILEYWARWSANLLSGHYILLYKGRYLPTTRRPSRPRARIELIGLPAGPPRLRVAAGEPAALRCRLTNDGDTRWLDASHGEFGCTRLGAHLYPVDSARAGEGFDWHRSELPGTVDPGQSVELDVRLPALDPGRYRVAFDMVAEQVVWFSQLKSPTLDLELDVV